MAPKSVVPFLAGMMLLTGVCNTLLTKYQDMQCVADCDTDRPKTFEQPVLQTLQMFIGESGCWLVVFAGFIIKKMRKNEDHDDEIEYERVEESETDTLDDGNDVDNPEDFVRASHDQTLVDPTNLPPKPLIDGEQMSETRRPLTGWAVTLLALPAICDILGTTLMNAGLLFVAASIYQMTRGALVLFVGLFSVIFLKRHLGGWKWASLFVVVAGVALVGLAGTLEKGAPVPVVPGHDPDQHDHVLRRAIKTLQDHTPGETLIGILMIAGAQIFTASQFVIEESIMERYSMEPIQVVGWEGAFGFLFTLLGMIILHLAIGRTDAGRGGYFDAISGLNQMFSHSRILITSIAIMISIGCFNFFGLSVTRQISATARSTIDTCRTLFIWLVSLGLGWETFKLLQVAGFILLVYGTAVFNEIIPPPQALSRSWWRRNLERRN